MLVRLSLAFKKMAIKITIVGGGTGSFVALSGLKKLPYELAALVTVSDDGGSTGRLRDEFGFLPVGDLRQCIAALADEEKDRYLTRLLLYRFTKGKGLKGHNLGNLILTALSDIYGSETKALEIVNAIFHLKGKVFPISLTPVKLVATYSSGQRIISEHQMEEYGLKEGERIVKLEVTPPAVISPLAKKVILESNYIIFGPGDLFGSTIANLVIDKVKETLIKTKARLIMIMNLMTLKSQTGGMTAKDHLVTLEKYLGRPLDYIIINSQPISQEVKEWYRQQGEHPVEDDLGKDKRVIRAALIDEKRYQKSSADPLKRSLLRHHSFKLAMVISGIVEENE